MGANKRRLGGGGMMRMNFNPPLPGLFGGRSSIKGSLISPSSARQPLHPPKQSLGLILKAALAEQDGEATSGGGRGFLFSEDFNGKNKNESAVWDKENFSGIFSPIHSGKGDITEIVKVEPFLLEESQSSEEEQIT